MRFVCMQGLYKKEWKLFALQITLSRHPISVVHIKNVSVQHPNNMRKYISKLQKIGSAHLQYARNQYAMLE